MRALPAILVIAALIAGAVFVADRPGAVSLTWEGWRVNTSIAVMIFGVALIATIAAALFHLVRKIVAGPGAYARARRERRRRRGYRALTQGMVAVAAGDAAEAKRFARQADLLLAEPPLTLLLSAQAAQLNGDQKAAQNYFAAMLERPETEFLGLRGLIIQALKQNDEAEALRLARRAKALRPKTPWVLASLFDLQARTGKWDEAGTTLTLAARRKALPESEISPPSRGDPVRAKPRRRGRRPRARRRAAGRQGERHGAGLHPGGPAPCRSIACERAPAPCAQGDRDSMAPRAPSRACRRLWLAVLQ